MNKVAYGTVCSGIMAPTGGPMRMATEKLAMINPNAAARCSRSIRSAMYARLGAMIDTLWVNGCTTYIHDRRIMPLTCAMSTAMGATLSSCESRMTGLRPFRSLHAPSQGAMMIDRTAFCTNPEAVDHATTSPCASTHASGDSSTA